MELLIVVSILGILAAVVLPEFQGHQQKAKEAAAKANLQLLRTAIERYALDHNGIPPGYLNGVFSSNTVILNAQLLYCSNSNGDTLLKKIKSGAYSFGPYLNVLPKNPFNNKDTFQIIEDSATMPATASGDYGWIYHPNTKEIRLDYSGNDSEGKSYYSTY